jgi:hypothetical protein
MRQHPITIKKYMSSYIYATGVVIAVGPTFDATTTITAMLPTAGNGGNPVPLQASTGPLIEGLLGTATHGINALLIDVATGAPAESAVGNEIFTEFDEATRILTGFSMVAGVKTATDIPVGTYKLGVGYQFQVDNLPNDAIIRFGSHQVSQDSGGGGARIVQESVAVTALNTLANLTFPVADVTLVSVNIDGHVETQQHGAFTVTNASNAITWAPLVAEYPLTTADKVTVSYTR